MKFGTLEIFEIDTGRFRLDGGAMFGVVPKPLWEKKISADTQNRIELALRALLVRGPGYNCLIDCGMGENWSQKERSLFEIHNQALDECLKSSAGLGLDDITHVIITHLHFDHAGGLSRPAPDPTAPLLANFPRAQIFVHEENLKWASSPNAREKASYLEANWKPYLDSGQIVTVKCERQQTRELLPGLVVERSDGHTIGQMIVHIIGGAEHHMVYCGDLIPTSAHLPEAWTMGYDLQPLVLMQERKRLLEAATLGNWWLYFEHDARYALSRVIRRERRPGTFVFEASGNLIEKLEMLHNAS